MTNEARELAEAHGGVWGAHPKHPVADWTYEVGNDDTRAGYWDWVLTQLDCEKNP